jgi:hypothetical protein
MTWTQPDTADAQQATQAIEHTIHTLLAVLPMLGYRRRAPISVSKILTAESILGTWECKKVEAAAKRLGLGDAVAQELKWLLELRHSDDVAHAVIHRKQSEEQLQALYADRQEKVRRADNMVRAVLDQVLGSRGWIVRLAAIEHQPLRNRPFLAALCAAPWLPSGARARSRATPAPPVAGHLVRGRPDHGGRERLWGSRDGRAPAMIRSL